jgi:hypothetical protein
MNTPIEVVVPVIWPAAKTIFAFVGATARLSRFWLRRCCQVVPPSTDL